MSQKLALVVIGATGQQGGAVVKSLRERGHEVRAVTRNTDSAKAEEQRTMKQHVVLAPVAA